MVTDSVKFLVDAMVRQDDELRQLGGSECGDDAISLKLHEYRHEASRRTSSGCLC